MNKYSTIVQWSDEDEGYIAIVPELPNVSAFGKTKEEALKQLEVAQKAVLEVYKEDGCPLPEPDKLREFSGQLRIRIPKSLHAGLSIEAKKEGISLNAHIVYLLSKRSEASKAERTYQQILFAIHNQASQDQHVHINPLTRVEQSESMAQIKNKVTLQ